MEKMGVSIKFINFNCRFVCSNGYVGWYRGTSN